MYTYDPNVYHIIIDIKITYKKMNTFILQFYELTQIQTGLAPTGGMFKNCLVDLW